MTPIEAAAIAAELHRHLELLVALDLHPAVNARAIETHRRLALECTETLTGYLHLSDAFAPVVAA